MDSSRSTKSKDGSKMGNDSMGGAGVGVVDDASWDGYDSTTSVAERHRRRSSRSMGAQEGAIMITPEALSALMGIEDPRALRSFAEVLVSKADSLQERKKVDDEEGLPDTLGRQNIGGGRGEQHGGLSSIMVGDRSELERRGSERSVSIDHHEVESRRLVGGGGRRDAGDGVARQHVSLSRSGASSGGLDKFYKIVEAANLVKLTDYSHFLRFEKVLKRVAASAHCSHVFEREVQMEEGDATVNLFTQKLREAVDVNLEDVVEMDSIKEIMTALKKGHVKWQTKYRGLMRDQLKALESMGGRNMVAWKRAAREAKEQLESAGVVVDQDQLKDTLVKTASKVEKYEKYICALKANGSYDYDMLCEKLEC